MCSGRNLFVVDMWGDLRCVDNGEETQEQRKDKITRTTAANDGGNLRTLTRPRRGYCRSHTEANCPEV